MFFWPQIFTRGVGVCSLYPALSFKYEKIVKTFRNTSFFPRHIVVSLRAYLTSTKLFPPHWGIYIYMCVCLIVQCHRVLTLSKLIHTSIEEKFKWLDARVILEWSDICMYVCRNHWLRDVDVTLNIEPTAYNMSWSVHMLKLYKRWDIMLTSIISNQVIHLYTCRKHAYRCRTTDFSLYGQSGGLLFVFKIQLRAWSYLPPQHALAYASA